MPKQSELKDYFLRVTAPQLPASLLPLFLRALEQENVFRSMPCGKLHSDPIFRPGAMMLGDGFNVKEEENSFCNGSFCFLKVRHPLTGGGMTVAFNDVWLLTEGLASVPFFRDDKAISKVQKQFFEERKNLAAQINILAQALYEVFSNDLLAEACVKYFLLGGEAVDGKKKKEQEPFWLLMR